ncbi:MAG TPA: S8 family serine peptidase [Thermoleophilaceae bacterium]|nr:S8 family serine peptidase [Thermoleophilaceae bacterium]
MLAAAALSAVLVAPAAGAAPAGEETGAAAYDEDAVIVSYRRGVGPAELRPLLERNGVERAIDEIPAVDAEVVRVEGDPARVAERLESHPKVDYAEPDYVVRAQASRPDDAEFESLWGLSNRGQTGGRRGADIGAIGGWRRAGLLGYPRRGGVPVGVIDTGVAPRHPDLRRKVVACTSRRTADLLGGCHDDSGHGTHVAGTLAAVADNGRGVAGVAFNSPLIVCRALGGVNQTGYTSDIAKCVDWVKRRGARVISMSFASEQPSTTLHRALKAAWKGGRRGGAVLVAAAGNHQSGQSAYRASYPAAFGQVVSVGSTDDHDRHAEFSNVHRTVELVAPGVDILSTGYPLGYSRLSGTSMSAPHVAGVAAQLRNLHPRWRAWRVRRVMRATADGLGPQGKDSTFGYGRVDLARAARR